MPRPPHTAGGSHALQFRKKGSTTYTTYTTLKTVKSGAGEAVTATTTATSDGYYRSVFAGNDATAAVSATGDCVDVQ
ncbi:hypothetical protein ACFWYA_14670 [Streptomyces sp. NPDC059011]|uniref:hypothetical protein n=1 Tax=unclassified Streptomyces TaxID=2593676 RepID=UPI0036C57C17